MLENVKYKHNVLGGQDVFHIGICDDEMHTCAELEKVLYECADELGVSLDIGVWYRGETLCKYLKDEVLDLLFLDIELISTDGIKVGKYIRDILDNSDMMIVYISSKNSYAMSLFKVQPLDFLIKPLDRREICQVLAKAVALNEKKNLFFECSSRGCRYKVYYKDIMYFYSQDKKINIVTKNEKLEFNGKLKNVVQEVPHNFLQIHQSFLVNLDFISKCTYEEIEMQNGTILSISQPYRKKVRDTIMANKWES